MKKNNVQFITRTALIAAAYAALTYAFAWMSYEQLQFRISEILVLFVFIEPRYGLGLVLGCILANLASPLGVIDIVAGSTATLLAIMFIVHVRKIFGCNKKAPHGALDFCLSGGSGVRQNSVQRNSNLNYILLIFKELILFLVH